MNSAAASLQRPASSACSPRVLICLAALEPPVQLVHPGVTRANLECRCPREVRLGPIALTEAAIGHGQVVVGGGGAGIERDGGFQMRGGRGEVSTREGDASEADERRHRIGPSRQCFGEQRPGSRGPALIEVDVRERDQRGFVGRLQREGALERRGRGVEVAHCLAEMPQVVRPPRVCRCEPLGVAQRDARGVVELRSHQHRAELTVLRERDPHPADCRWPRPRSGARTDP